MQNKILYDIILYYIDKKYERIIKCVIYISNLVKCVKEYTNYETKTFEKITKLRAEYMNKKELTKAGILYTEVNKTVLLLENYPKLKANEELLKLQKNLTKMEN